MFAVLGDIEFELITYWDGFEATFGVDYAEHARIEGKPGLQFIGDKLDEIQISLVFHQHYCVPDVELARLRTAMKAHQALALVFGNGDYRGWFVITDVTATSDLGLVVHHPKLGIALKEQMDKLGIECIVQYRAPDGNRTIRHGGGETSSALRFIQKHFESAAK